MTRVRRPTWRAAALGVLAVLLAAPDPGAAPARAEEAAPAQDPWRALQEGRIDVAAEGFRLRLAQDPSDADALVGRVRSLLAAQRWLEALAEARTHAARLPDEPRVAGALGEALFRAGRLDEVEQVVGPLVAHPTPDARALWTLGRLRAAEGRPGEAQRLAARAVDLAPDDRDIVYWASGLTQTRAGAIGLLEHYLELADGDDPRRVEAARGTLRLFSALGERPIWSDRNRPERLELPLGLVWDAASGASVGYVVSARLGPKTKPVKLLLDSGSPGLLVIERIARKHGLEPLAETVSVGGGAEGRHEQMRGLFPTIDVGGRGFADVLATVSRREIDPTGRFHGLLGLAAFNGYRATLDLPGKRLLLERDAGPSAAGATYWTVSGQVLVRAELRPGGPGLFLLDSGATRSAVSLALAERIEGARLGGKTASLGVGGLIEARRLDGVEVMFQGLAGGRHGLSAVDLSSRSEVGGVEISGLIGLDLLGEAVIVFDTVNRTVSAQRARPLEPG